MIAMKTDNIRNEFGGFLHGKIQNLRKPHYIKTICQEKNVSFIITMIIERMGRI